MNRSIQSFYEINQKTKWDNCEISHSIKLNLPQTILKDKFQMQKHSQIQ